VVVNEEEKKEAEDEDGWMIELPPRGVTKAVEKLLLDIRREDASVEAVGRNFMVAAVE